MWDKQNFSNLKLLKMYFNKLSMDGYDRFGTCAYVFISKNVEKKKLREFKTERNS